MRLAVVVEVGDLVAEEVGSGLPHLERERLLLAQVRLLHEVAHGRERLHHGEGRGLADDLARVHRGRRVLVAELGHEQAQEERAVAERHAENVAAALEQTQDELVRLRGRIEDAALRPSIFRRRVKA